MEKQDAVKVYNALSRPPKDALKTIQAGRLKGMTDINPQWRYRAMTEQFGLVGIGWKYDIVKLWREEGAQGEVFAHAQVAVYIKDGDHWSDPIEGIGGSKLVSAEKSGAHSNDEGYKMAVTDAFGTALKMLGVAADIYAGRWDGSKYKDPPPQQQKPQSFPKTDESVRLAQILDEYIGAGILKDAYKQKAEYYMAQNDIKGMNSTIAWCKAQQKGATA